MNAADLGGGLAVAISPDDAPAPLLRLKQDPTIPTGTSRDELHLYFT